MATRNIPVIPGVDHPDVVARAETCDQKPAGPVTPQELERAALRIAQAASIAQILTDRGDSDVGRADLTNALGLLTDYLEQCASELSSMHERAERNVEEVRT